MSVLTCPVCQGAMREMNKDGILIDVCTQCRGVWLDRGELEKLAAFMAPPPRYAPDDASRPAPGNYAPPLQGRDDYAQRPPYAPRERERERGRDWDDDDDDDRRYRGDNRGYQQKSKVARFLDFFD